MMSPWLVAMAWRVHVMNVDHTDAVSPAGYHGACYVKVTVQ